MKPQLSPISECRACGSSNLSRNLVRKSYYLMNLDQTVDLSYGACTDCQFIFQGESVSDHFLNHYYKNSPMLRRPKPTKYEEDQNERQAKFVERYFDLQNRSVLEIGAHAGAFLSYVHRKFGCVAYFDELSEEARAVMSEIPGLNDARKEKGLAVDVVVLRHVLEHIYDVPSFMGYVRKLLKEDGILFVEVPDWSWLDGHTDPLIFEHLSQFSTHNLVTMMRNLGWQCEALEKSIDPDDPATPNRVQRLIFKPSPLPSLGKTEFGQVFVEFYQRHEGQGSVKFDLLLEKIGQYKKIALYPASHLTFAAITETRVRTKNLVGIFDIDPKKQGRVIKDVPVFAAEDLKEHDPDYIFLFTMAYEPEIRESFIHMGLKAKVISLMQILANAPEASVP